MNGLAVSRKQRIVLFMQRVLAPFALDKQVAPRMYFRSRDMTFYRVLEASSERKKSLSAQTNDTLCMRFILQFIANLPIRHFLPQRVFRMTAIASSADVICNIFLIRI